MCEAIEDGGERCAGHTRRRLEAKLGRYCAAYQDGPSPCVLMAADLAGTTRIGDLNGHVKVAKHLVRDAETDEVRAEAERYLAAARAKLQARWASVTACLEPQH